MAGNPPPPGGKPPPAPPPRAVVLATAKLTIAAPAPRVFEALINQGMLTQWWASDARIEAEMSGRYEGTLPEGRVDGTITAIDGPRKFSYMWPIAHEGGSVETSVAYELSPKGPQTFVHLAHRAPIPVPGDWNAVSTRALESLKAFLEAGAGGSDDPSVL